MSDLIIAQPKDMIWNFVCGLQGSAHPPREPYTALGLVRNGRLIAGVLYNHFEEGNVFMHVSALKNSHWAKLDFGYAVFSYPFEQLGKRRVTSISASRDKTAHRLAERLGFTYEGRLRNYYQDDDAILYGMLREECRYLEKRRLAA